MSPSGAGIEQIGADVIKEDVLERFLTETMNSDAKVLSHEPIFGGWNSAMSKAVVDLGDGPTTVVVRGDLPAAARVITSDLTSEWEVLSALTDHGAGIAPAAQVADLTGEYLGRPAILTEFIDGVSLQMAVLGSSPDTHGGQLDEFARLAARIHRVPLDALPQCLEVAGSWEEYIDERLAGWRETEAAWIERDPTMRYVAAWLDTHRPDPLPLTLVHGDFHTSNVMVTGDGTQVAVDWELAHVGDPREDLGWPMIYESIAPPALVTQNQDRFCRAYRAQTGLGEDTINPTALAWFSLLNIAVVVQTTTPAARSIVDGTSTSLTAAMGLVMGMTHAQHCLRTISALEDAS